MTTQTPSNPLNYSVIDAQRETIARLDRALSEVRAALAAAEAKRREDIRRCHARVVLGWPNAADAIRAAFPEDFK